jgi:hypothetical protein
MDHPVRREKGEKSGGKTGEFSFLVTMCTRNEKCPPISVGSAQV